MAPSRSGSNLPLILASGSPRRVELLQKAGIEFEQRPADIDESPLGGEPAHRYVVRLAEEKARAAWCPGTRSLGADTVVVLGDQILGKPRDTQHAKCMLRSLSGRSHRVLTGVAVFDGRSYKTHCEETVVWLREVAEHEIGEYVSSGEPFDKAGGYGIQGGASRFIESIEGSYSNVVGLPVDAVTEMVR